MKFAGRGGLGGEGVDPAWCIDKKKKLNGKK